MIVPKANILILINQVSSYQIVINCGVKQDPAFNAFLPFL